MNKISCASQNTKAKILHADVTSLVDLDGFNLLLPTQLTANLTLEWSGGSMFNLLSHFYAKNSFLFRWNSYKQRSESSTHCCFWLTVSKRNNYVWTQLFHGQIFTQNSEYTTIWYLQLLCYVMQLFPSAKISLWRDVQHNCTPDISHILRQSKIKLYKTI